MQNLAEQFTQISKHTNLGNSLHAIDRSYSSDVRVKVAIVINVRHHRAALEVISTIRDYSLVSLKAKQQNSKSG